MNTCLGPGRVSDWLAANPDKLPVNGQIITASIMATCLILYVIVSLLTCRTPYDLDKLLHRGKYRIEDGGDLPVEIASKFRLSKLIGINDNFTRGDRRIVYFTFWWGLVPNLIGIIVIIWNLAFARWSPQRLVGLAIFLGRPHPAGGRFITTIWFTWGVWKDMFQLFRDLKIEQVDDDDDGQVHDDAVE